MLDMVLMSATSGDDSRTNAALGGMAAGGLAGGTAGFLSLKPLEVARNARAEKEAIQAYKDFSEETNAIAILNKIHKGQISWNDVPDSMRSMLQKTYEANKEFFNDSAEVAARLREKGPAPVVSLARNPNFLSNNMLPDKQMFSEFGEHVKNPIVRRTAMAGALGGGLLAKMLHDNKEKARQAQLKEEARVNREEEIKKVINDFLSGQK